MKSRVCLLGDVQVLECHYVSSPLACTYPTPTLASLQHLYQVLFVLRFVVTDSSVLAIRDRDIW